LPAFTCLGGVQTLLEVLLPLRQEVGALFCISSAFLPFCWSAVSYTYGLLCAYLYVIHAFGLICSIWSLRSFCYSYLFTLPGFAFPLPFLPLALCLSWPTWDFNNVRAAF
jgi:hypothetical protein